MNDLCCKYYEDEIYGPSFIFYKHGQFSFPMMILTESEMEQMGFKYTGKR